MLLVVQCDFIISFDVKELLLFFSLLIFNSERDYHNRMVSSIGNNKQKGSKKGGGSVLKRLKSNLKDLGLIGP